MKNLVDAYLLAIQINSLAGQYDQALDLYNKLTQMVEEHAAGLDDETERELWAVVSKKLKRVEDILWKGWTNEKHTTKVIRC